VNCQGVIYRDRLSEIEMATTNVVEKDSGESYEVVIAPDKGYSEQHAELLRERLIEDGFFEDVVAVREK
jgi:FKBP-type peptidyl-prolyl cis-trans isomerase 2